VNSGHWERAEKYRIAFEPGVRANQEVKASFAGIAHKDRICYSDRYPVQDFAKSLRTPLAPGARCPSFSNTYLLVVAAKPARGVELPADSTRTTVPLARSTRSDPKDERSITRNRMKLPATGRVSVTTNKPSNEALRVVPVPDRAPTPGIVHMKFTGTLRSKRGASRRSIETTQEPGGTRQYTHRIDALFSSVLDPTFAGREPRRYAPPWTATSGKKSCRGIKVGLTLERCERFTIAEVRQR
jgi:hypothetical protein